jgi:phosphatidylglycerophosphate synthase
MDILAYIFDPHPEPVGYGNAKVIALLVLALVLMVSSIVLRMWRARQQNPMTRKLSRSWPTAAFWFGASALVMVVARTEDVLFIAMRFFWVLWILALVAFVVIQWRLFSARHYTVVKTISRDDPREKYLPKKKRR